MDGIEGWRLSEGKWGGKHNGSDNLETRPNIQRQLALTFWKMRCVRVLTLLHHEDNSVSIPPQACSS